MTTYTLAQLLDPPDEDEELDTLLNAPVDGLKDRGFPVTNWASGGVSRTLTQIEAKALADLWQLVRVLAMAGLLDLSPGTDPGSPGDWLTPLALSAYQLARNAAVFARGTVTVSCASTAGPYTFTPGQLWFLAGDGVHRYNATNPSNVTVTAGSSVDIPVVAESPGAAYNVPLSTSLTLVTPLPGVTAQFTDLGSGDWKTTQGADEESDASLRDRCRRRWATIGLQKTQAAYEFLATNAKDASGHPVLGVTKAFVDDTNPRGPDTVDVYLAGDDGGITDAPTIAAVRTYVRDRQAASADVNVVGATNDTVALAAAVTVPAGTTAAVQAALSMALAEYQKGLAIGAPVYRAKLIELIEDAGATNVNIGTMTPGADYTPGLGHIAKLSYVIGGGSPTITFVEV